jgi:hypothetical protein
MTYNANAQIKVGDKKDDGIVYWVDSTGTHGLIADVKDLGKFTWDTAVIACKNKGEGWYLPSRDELDKLYEKKDKVGGFDGNFYWCSTNSKWNETSSNSAFLVMFDMGGMPMIFKKSDSATVRAVRAF